MKPELVISPKDKLEPGSLEVVFTAKDKRWSVAKMVYDGQEVVGIRWNGDDDDSLGNPQSSGHATW